MPVRIWPLKTPVCGARTNVCAWSGRFYHDMLTTGQNDTAKPNHPLVADRIADNGKCFLSDPIGRGDVVGANRVAIIDFGARHEAVDFDRMSALDLDLFEFVVLDREVLALANLVAATNVLLFDRLAGFGIDELLPSACFRSLY